MDGKARWRMELQLPATCAPDGVAHVCLRRLVGLSSPFFAEPARKSDVAHVSESCQAASRSGLAFAVVEYVFIRPPLAAAGRSTTHLLIWDQMLHAHFLETSLAHFCYPARCCLASRLRLGELIGY